MARLIQALAAAAILVPLTALADEVEILGGGFEFSHAPVDPFGAEVCEDGSGLQFSVSSDRFDGLLDTTMRHGSAAPTWFFKADRSPLTSQ